MQLIRVKNIYYSVLFCKKTFSKTSTFLAVIFIYFTTITKQVYTTNTNHSSWHWSSHLCGLWVGWN